MDAFSSYLNGLINKNKALLAAYPEINWINPYIANESLSLRRQLLEKAPKLFNETKPYYKHISKGCQLCGEGLWSCLFITNRCNANCFYCPTSQSKDEVPSTQGIDFTTADDYAAYVNHLGFKAVAFSGGEPLLYPNRVEKYLKAVRSQCNPDIYTWMYTNGLLASTRFLKLLADAGLNEIRFDIGATRYLLDKVRIAKGIIPVVTIEIPAVPEEIETLKKLLPDLADAGVTNLNLHQLRLTPHNAKHLLKRKYTYIPAERPVVLESELAALEIIDHAHRHSFDIGINYCSFFYKHRFQKAGFRRVLAQKFGDSTDHLTENGFIRHIDKEQLQYNYIKLMNQSDEKTVGQVVIIGNKKYNLQRIPSYQTHMGSGTNNSDLRQLMLKAPAEIPVHANLFAIWQHEYIEHGLRDL